MHVFKGKASLFAAALAAILATGAPNAAGAADQESDLAVVKRELRAIKAELSALRRELRQMRGLLRQDVRQRNRPTTTKVRVKSGVPTGRQDAPVTVVEFSDYQCPFCRRFVERVLPRIKKDYVETGKVRYVFKDFPIQRIHKRAVAAASAARCAGEQGKYWEMHDKLFANQKKLSEASFKAHATGLGLDEVKFGQCLTDGRHKKDILANQRDGQSAGVRGTPTFVVGRTTKGDIMEGAIVRGAQPYNVFKRVIEETLKPPKTGKSNSR